MADLAALLADLDAETAELDALVAGLADAQWRWPTPAEGWTIAMQIAHLAWTDDAAVAAACDPAAFEVLTQQGLREPATFIDDAAAVRATLPPGELLTGWRSGRSALATALRALPDGAKLPWFGPPMGAASMATARLMETWAHGLDVADTLGAVREPSDRLRHIAHIGARTRDFAYLLRGLPVPAEQFRIELSGPSGDLWAWGPTDAVQRVTGPALDFCLLVTQRRHRGDLAVVASGADADAWLDIAQAFAGAPGAGRPAA